MAPRVDRPVVRAPRQVELVGPRPQGRGPETDQRPGKTPKSFDHLEKDGSCHSSRVKVHAAGGDDNRRRTESPSPPGGRLAQLVRALP
jgi:hypothetical protein